MKIQHLVQVVDTHIGGFPWHEMNELSGTIVVVTSR